LPRKLKKDLAELLRTHVPVSETRIGSVRYPGLYAPQRTSVRKVRASSLPLLVPKICIFFSFDRHEHDCATSCAKIVPTVTYAIRDKSRSKYTVPLLIASSYLLEKTCFRAIRTILPSGTFHLGGTRRLDEVLAAKMMSIIQKMSIAARNSNYIYALSCTPSHSALRKYSAPYTHCGIQEPFLPALLDARRNARSSFAHLHRAPLLQPGSRKNSSLRKSKVRKHNVLSACLMEGSTAFSAPQNAPKLCCRTLIAKLRVKRPSLDNLERRRFLPRLVWTASIRYDGLGAWR
jgi:hypothetical protein